MSVVTRCGAVSLVLALLVGAAPALAENASGDASGSSWTDPPVRGSAAPEAPVPVRPAGAKPPAAAETPAPVDAAKPARSAAAPPAATPAEQAAARLGVKPVEAGRRTASSGPASVGRRAVVRPRMVERPLVIARRPGRLVERLGPALAQRQSRRAIRSYAYAPMPARADAYDGRGYAATWSRRRLAGWGGLIDDNPASRIARAREAGYMVMRMRTYAYPDGTRVQRLMPYDGGGFGELD